MPRGFGAVRRAAAELENRRGGAGGSGVFYFKLKPGEEAIVRFLEQDDEVYCADTHEIPQDGRSWGRHVPCLDQERNGTPCPGCEADMPRKFKGYINLIWFNAPVFRQDADGKLWRDSNGNLEKIGEGPRVAVWESGIRLFEELEEINANFKGLRSRRFRVKRKGSGLDTKYSISPEDIDSGPQHLTPEEQDLAQNKYDLNRFVTPSSYDEFARTLNGGVGYVNQQPHNSPQMRANPFMRHR